MDWGGKAASAAWQSIGYGRSYAEGERRAGFNTGARWQREQLLSDESVERVARALNGAGWVCMGCEYEPFDFDKCPSCREVCTKQARAALTALLGEEVI